MRWHAVMLVLVTSPACGGGEDAVVDAGVDAIAKGDAGTDARVDAGPPGPVDVTIETTSHHPIAGAIIAISEPGAPLVERTTADEQGHAIVQVMPGATLSVIQVEEFRSQIESVAAIQPGDHVRVYLAEPDQVDVVFLVDAPTFPSATFYELRSSCAYVAGGSGSPSVAVAIDSRRCPSTVDLLLRAYVPNNETQKLVASMAVAAVPTADGHYSFPEAWRPPLHFVAHYSGFDPMIDEVTLTRDADQVRAARPAAATSLELGLLVAQIPRLTTVSSFFASGESYQTVIEAIDGTALDYTLDVAARGLLPWITDSSFEPTTQGEYDGVHYSVDCLRGGGREIVWRYTSPSLADHTFPRLPVDLTGGCQPPTRPTEVSTELFRIPGDGGYAAVRQDPAVVSPPTVAGHALQFSRYYGDGARSVTRASRSR